MPRILVTGGCGLMGAEVTRDLAATSDFSEIVIADLDVERASALAAALGGGRVRAVRVDLSDPEGLTAAMRGFHVVANCATYHFGVVALRAAIAARAHYLDLGGLMNTPAQLALDGEARAAGVTACLGSGCTPGLSNLLAKRAADRLGSARRVEIHFCSYRDLAPSPGLLDTILDEFAEGQQRFYWERGEFVPVGAFEGEKTARFQPPLGDNRCYFMPHSETHTVHRFLPGVEHVSVRGAWRPSAMQAMAVFSRCRLLDDEGRRFLRARLLAHPPIEPGAPFGFFLNVEVTAADGRRAVYTTSHPEWGASCTAKMTGIPASIMAQMIAHGRARAPGVLAPEACFDPEEVFAELSRRGVAIHEEG